MANNNPGNGRFGLAGYLVLMVAAVGVALTIAIAVFVGQTPHASDDLQRTILKVGLLSSAVLSLAGILAAHWIIRPLAAMTDHVRAMAQGGQRPHAQLPHTYREAATLDEELSALNANYEHSLLLNQQRAAEHHATHDSLTGLPTRHVFMERVNEAIARTQRSRRPLAVLAVDINKFKGINDTLGHAEGDGVLSAFAATLASCVRKTDTVTRISADQFAILAEEFNGGDRDAVIIAEKIYAALEQQAPPDPRIGKLSASIGIAIQHGADENDGEELMARAHRAMLESKGIAGGGWAHG
jgi:diguanylate cyclase (GGDEF)-like protein